MVEVYLSAQQRNLIGKQGVKQLRQKGQIPAIVYGRKVKPTPIQVNQEALIKVLHTSAGENVIIKLDIIKDGREDSNKQKREAVNVIIKEIQQHPITMDILHVDFAQVSLTEKIVVKVPIKTKGEPIGVTRDNGILEVPLWEVEIECLPTDIPEEIGLQVENLEIGDTLHIKDIVPPKGVKILEDSERAVVLIAPPRKIEEEVEEAEIIEEPEVIREKEEKEEVKPEEEEAKQAPEE